MILKVIAFRQIASCLLRFGVFASILYFAFAWFQRTPVKVLHSTIRVGDLEREYRLVIPDCTRGQKNLPVVFALHGAVHTTDRFAEETGLDHLAAKHGFLLVYLQGRLCSWPATVAPQTAESAAADLKFFDAMCDAMVARYAADRSRVYVVGSSQGGAMCNVLVAMRSDRIAAAVCHCGWMPEPLGEKPLNTLRKTPMLFIVGSLDVQVGPQAVKQACHVFAKAGHPVEFKIREGVGLGLEVDPGVGEIIWQFLSQKKRF